MITEIKGSQENATSSLLKKIRVGVFLGMIMAMALAIAYFIIITNIKNDYIISLKAIDSSKLLRGAFGY